MSLVPSCQVGWMGRWMVGLVQSRVVGVDDW